MSAVGCYEQYSAHNPTKDCYISSTNKQCFIDTINPARGHLMATLPSRPHITFISAGVQGTRKKLSKTIPDFFLSKKDINALI